MNNDRYQNLKSESNKLTSKLNELQERLNSRGDARSQRSDKIFSQIARKTMERKDKSKLMYAIPKDRQPGERSNFVYFNSLDPNAVDTV